MISGTLVAQLVAFAASPVLSRLYGPEEFGLYGLFVSLTAVVASVASWRYDLAIVLPETVEQSIAVAAVSMLATLATSLLVLVVVLAPKDVFGHLIHNPALDHWLWLMPIYVFLVSANQIYAQVNLRFSQYGLQARVRAGQSVGSAAFGIGLGTAGLGAGGMIFGAFISQLCVACFQTTRIVKSHIHVIRSLRSDVVLRLLHDYKRFPLYQVPATLLETVTACFPVILLAPTFGAETAGFFFLAQSVVRVPVGVLSAAASEIFRQRASRQFNATGECRLLFKRTLLVTAAIALPGFGIFGILAPDGFALVFGDRWRTSGEYAQVMAVMFTFQFVASPLSAVFIVAKRLGHDLALQVGTFISVGLAFAIGVFVFLDPLATLVLYGLAYSIRYSLQIILAYRYSGGVEATDG